MTADPAAASPFDPTRQNHPPDLDLKIVAGLERLSEVFRTMLWHEAKQVGLSPLADSGADFFAFSRRGPEQNKPSGPRIRPHQSHRERCRAGARAQAAGEQAPRAGRYAQLLGAAHAGRATAGRPHRRVCYAPTAGGRAAAGRAQARPLFQLVGSDSGHAAGRHHYGAADVLFPAATMPWMLRAAISATSSTCRWMARCCASTAPSTRRGPRSRRPPPAGHAPGGPLETGSGTSALSPVSAA